MDNDIKKIQNKLMGALDKLSEAQDTNLKDEVSRSNAIAQVANTYIKSCNLIIRVEEAQTNIKSHIEMMNNEE